MILYIDEICENIYELSDDELNIDQIEESYFTEESQNHQENDFLRSASTDKESLKKPYENNYQDEQQITENDEENDEDSSSIQKTNSKNFDPKKKDSIVLESENFECTNTKKQNTKKPF